MELLYLGGEGSDAPHWVIGPDGVPVWVDGWGVESLNDVRIAVAILNLSLQFKNPTLSKTVGEHVGRFVQHELAAFTGRNSIALG